MRVCLIGELRVVLDAEVRAGTALGSRKGRRVLARLAIERGRPVAAEQLAELLWPEGRPTGAEANVASLVSRLRRTLGVQLISGDRHGYRLGERPRVEVDLDEAARLVFDSERARDHDAADSANAALELLDAGGVLDGEPDAFWLLPARSEHSALLRRARHAATDARLAAQDDAGALSIASAALATDPLDEAACRGFMTALARRGEQAAALWAFERLRRGLAEELGVDPSPETRRLHVALLHGTTSAALPARPPAPPRRRPEVAAEQPPQLAGRDAEFAQLCDLFDKTVSGGGSMVLLTGSAGVGKTRLADELARVAADRGGVAVSTRCYDAERSLFLQPVVEAITSTLGIWPAATVRDAASEHAGSLARLVPAVAAALGDQDERSGPVDIERRRAFEAVSTFLCGLARHRPIVLTLDDLHNAGRSTVEFLHFLRVRLPTARVLVVATVRTLEGAEALATLQPVAHRIDLGPLSDAAVHRLAERAGRADLAATITQRTRGHALFVVEILRGLSAGGDGVPDSLQAAVLAMLARAGDSAEAVLRAGAVLGSVFEPRDAAALAGVTIPVGLAACERALDARLLAIAGRRYEFANDLIREVLYATTPEPSRAAHHALAADRFVEQPETVAGHAAAIDDWPRAGRSWLRAAEQALARFAAADAANLAGRALAAAARIDDADLRGRALIVRGQARYAGASYEPAWDDFAAAVQAAVEAGDRRLEMLALRETAGDVWVVLGRPPAECEPPLRRCLALAEALGDRVTAAEALDRLSILAANRLDFVSALDLGRQAQRVGAAAGDVRAREHALDALKTCYAYLGETDELAQVIDELEPLQRRTGDLWFLQWTVFESAFIPLAVGDYSAATTRIEAALAINRRSGFAVMEPWYLAHLGWTRRLAGDLEGALEIGAQALAAARERRHGWWLAASASLYGATLLQAGEPAAAAQVLQAARPPVEVAGAEAYLLRCLGPLAEASGSIEVLERADGLLRTIAAPDGSAWLTGADAYLGVARAWAARGELDRSRTVLAPFVAAARRVPWPDLVRLAEEVG